MKPGDRIKKIREELGLSMDSFAKLIEVKTKGNINNWEKNRYYPNIEQLIKISEISGRSIDWILTGAEDKPDIKNSIIYHHINEKLAVLERLEKYGITTTEQLDKLFNPENIAEDIKELLINRYKRKKK